MQSTRGFILCALCFLCLPALVLSACGTPSAGYCNTNNSRHTSDKQVFPVDRLHCLFQSDLCFYRQGCQDPNMSQWTAGNGYAEVRQLAAGCGGDSYSVLESLWINFTVPVCLQFSFSRYSPQALEAFLAPGTTRTEVQTLLGRRENKLDNGEDQTVRLTIKPSIGKILFRMYGGAHTADTPSLSLYPVTVEAGGCEPPACNFSDAENPFCGWTSRNWVVGGQPSSSGLNFITVRGTDGVATLTSPLTRATGENDRDCLEFEFKLKNDDDSIDVAIRTSGVSILIWSLHNMSRNPSNTGFPWINASVQIGTQNAYQIVLKGQRPRQSGRVSVRHIAVTTGRSCSTLPVEAAVNVSLPLGTATPTPDRTGGSDKPGDSGASNDGAIIGGTIAAVIVVIIVAVVTGILLYRRKQARKSENSHMAVDSSGFRNGPHEEKNEVDSHDYLEIQDSQRQHPVDVDDYTVIDHAPSTPHVTGPHDDVNPYEVSEDGSVRKTPVVNGHNYRRLQESQNPSSAGHSLHTDEGDYSYISDAKNSPRPDRSNDTEGDYSHIGDSQNFPKHDAGNDSYSHIGDSQNFPKHDAGNDSYSHIGDSQNFPKHDAGNDSYSHIGDSQNFPKHDAGNDSYSHIGDSQNSPKHKVDSSVNDSYSRIGDSHNSPRHGVADDYSHIGSSNNSPKHEVDIVSDGYSHINSAENSPRQDGDYNHTDSRQYSHPVGSKSHGHGSGKPSSPPSYELARIETEDKTGPQTELSHGYTLVSKKHQTPHTAASPPQTEGDDHIPDPEEHTATETTDTQPNKTAMVSMPAESDSHDQSQMHVANQNKFTTVTTARTEDPGDYSLQKPIHEDVEGYDILSFEEGRKQSLDKGRTAVTHKPYDHVQTDPDNNYSKTQAGNRNIVIDSDYDHLNP